MIKLSCTSIFCWWFEIWQFKNQEKYWFEWGNTHILENDLIWSLLHPWTAEQPVQPSLDSDSGPRHTGISPKEEHFSDSRWSSPDEDYLTLGDGISKSKAKNLLDS